MDKVGAIKEQIIDLESKLKEIKKQAKCENMKVRAINYYEEHKDEIKLKRRAYYEHNKEKILEKYHQANQKIKTELTAEELREKHEKLKKYRREYYRKYRDAHRDKIQGYQKKKKQCQEVL